MAEKMKVKLTLHDRKILGLLTENARLFESEIGKRTGISREMARYRIKRLKELRVISGFTVVSNLESLGYSTYELFISLKKADKKTEQEIIETIRGIGLVNFISTSIGEYDLLVECNARSAVELDDMLRIINNKHRESISRIVINTVLQEYNFPHNYLLGKPIERSGISFARYSEKEKEKIDETDKSILTMLSADSRIAHTEIAARLKVSADKVAYRIRQMESRGIIKGYKAILNTTIMGFDRYLFLFKIQATEQQERLLIEELKQSRETLYIMRCVGEWNIVADLCFKGITEMREKLQEIRGKHSSIIKESSVLIGFEEHKNQYFPGAETKTAKTPAAAGSRKSGNR